MKKFDVVALGELLIDFTDNGLSAQGNPVFEANPGGAPCNVLAMLRKLDKNVAFVGKVGCDGFGKQLADVVAAAGICTDGLKWDENVHTTLAVVHTLPGGDRDFSFYRNPGADMMLTEEELPMEMIENTRIFHFGTLSMTHEGVRKATLKAIDAAKKAGALISFDPNLRPPLWNSLEEAAEQIHVGLQLCDILKIADNELAFLTGETDLLLGAEVLRRSYPNIHLLCVTAGANGSYAFCGDAHVFVPAFCVRTVDTTGAGDTFGGCVLHHVLTHGLNLDETSLHQMLTFSNAAAALVTTCKGALRSMPDLKAINALLHI